MADSDEKQQSAGVKMFQQALSGITGAVMGITSIFSPLESVKVANAAPKAISAVADTAANGFGQVQSSTKKLDAAQATGCFEEFACGGNVIAAGNNKGFVNEVVSAIQEIAAAVTGPSGPAANTQTASVDTKIGGASPGGMTPGMSMAPTGFV